jgi:hypothetical protein
VQREIASLPGHFISRSTRWCARPRRSPSWASRR